MVRPVPSNIGVSFAYLRPYSDGRPHKGVDFGAPKGTTVFAAIDGTVWYAGNGGGWGPSYGAQVIVKGLVNGVVRYAQVAHLSRIDVKTGTKVVAGQQLGLSGGVPGQWGAGNTTGAHVHFQVNKSTTWDDHVDPWAAINSAPSGARLGKFLFLNPAAATVALRRPGGYSKWLYRRANVVRITKNIRPDVLASIECGSGAAWEYQWKKYLSFGLERVVWAGGRALFRRTETTGVPIDKGVFKPIPFDGDIKEVVWMVNKVDGAMMLTAAGHLDPTASASFNVRRAEQILDFLEGKLVQHGLGRSRLVFNVDMADKTGAVRKYIKSRGYASVFTEAERTVNGSLACMTYFKTPVEGPSVCAIFVWAGDNPRPVEVASKTIPPRVTDLDHLPLAAVLNRQ